MLNGMPSPHDASYDDWIVLALTAV